MSQQTHRQTSSHVLRESLLLFGLTGAWMWFNVNFINPCAVAAGAPLIWSFSLSFYLPLAVLFVAALFAFHAEGHAWNWPAFAQRMRLQRMTRRDWVWAIGGVLLALVVESLLEPTALWLAGTRWFAPPPMLPALLDPFQSFDIPPTSFMGTPLQGNPWVIGVYAISLFFNIVGEELAWRGYLLPKQEKVWGHWAWFISGLMWVFVLHFVMRWFYIVLLPTGLITPFVAQRTGNTWTAIIIHGTGNAIFLVLIVVGVF